MNCYSIVLVFAAVSLATAINPNTVPPRSDRRRLAAIKVNRRGGPRSSTDKDLASETRLISATLSRVHGGDQPNGGPESRSTGAVSVPVPREIAEKDDAVARASGAVSMSSAGQQVPSVSPVKPHVEHRGSAPWTMRSAKPVSDTSAHRSRVQLVPRRASPVPLTRPASNTHAERGATSAVRSAAKPVSVTDVRRAPLVSPSPRENRSRKTSTGPAAKGIARYVTFTVLSDRQTQRDRLGTAWSIGTTSGAPCMATGCLGTTRRPLGCEDADQDALLDMPAEEDEESSVVVADEPPELCGGDDIEENIPEEWTTFKVNRSAMLIVIMIVFVLSVCKIIMHETNARKCQSKENTVCLRLANCKCCARFSPHPFRSLP